MIPANACEEPKCSGSSVTINPLLANGKARRERLMPLVQKYPGSDTLSMMSISANYEGTYANLMRFVHELDRSPRLLIIEGLNAAPQATGGTLNISMKIDTFVRDDGLEP